ncbi:MAG: hypothetical protein AAF903_13895 [Pseudomonadota bacterium]
MSFMIGMAAVLTILLMYAAVAFFFATLEDDRMKRKKVSQLSDLYSPYTHFHR